MQRCSHVSPPAWKLYLFGNKPFICPYCNHPCMVNKQAFEKARRKSAIVANVCALLLPFLMLILLPWLSITPRDPILTAYITGGSIILIPFAYFRMYCYPQLQMVQCDSIQGKSD